VRSGDILGPEKRLLVYREAHRRSIVGQRMMETAVLGFGNSQRLWRQPSTRRTEASNDSDCGRGWKTAIARMSISNLIREVELCNPIQHRRSFQPWSPRSTSPNACQNFAQKTPREYRNATIPQHYTDAPCSVLSANSPPRTA